MSDTAAETLRPDSSPDELDRPLRLIKTPVAAATIGLLIIVAATAVWGAFGSISTSVEGSGGYTLGTPILQVQSTISGQVDDIMVKPGDQITEGQPLITIHPLADAASPVIIQASSSGTIRNIFVLEGEVVEPGTPTVSIVQTGTTPVAELAVPIEAAVAIEPGQPALVTPLGVASGSYGMLKGTVRSRSDLPMSQAAINSVLGSIDEDPPGTGPWVLVVVDLERDPGTASGLAWTTPAGDSLAVTPGQSVTAQVVVDDSSLFQRLIGE